MTDPLASGSAFTSAPIDQVRQTVDQNQGQVIAQMVGGLAVGQLTVYLSQIQTPSAEPSSASIELGQNPYQGLLSFRETDGDRFFGRSSQIEQLWQKFQQLHGDRAAIRILPVYGPSGSGKSSLARAGLIPALGKRPLPGRDHSRVVVLTPGSHPLDALATVLARMATHDSAPVAKTREFKDELLRSNSQQEFDGLRRIADAFPDISHSPLIVLVDQFEEIYTLCTEASERHAFVENLLCAGSDRAQRVSIILTLRSDFLGATQQHPRLNKLFSSQGFLVPIMQPEELEIAITEPAKQAGYTLDKVIVRWLIEETQEREAALPLLQFSLTQIWEGLRNKVDPEDTLQQIGGVGGALASEAQRLYNSLTPKQQQVARCIFLALVQINEDNKCTRRRAAISELITGDSDGAIVREVIDRFACPGVWILVTSCNEQQIEMLEVAHEALLRNWQQLQEWLKEHWAALREKRKIEQAAIEWKNQKKSKAYLWQEQLLRNANLFCLAHKGNSETALSNLATEFLQAGIRKKRDNLIKSILILLVFPLFGTIIVIPEISVAIQTLRIDQAKDVLFEDDCIPNLKTRKAIEYLLNQGYGSELSGLKLCGENLPNINLSRADLSTSDLREINLGGADLRGTFLIKANLKNAKLVDTNLYGAFLRGAQMQRIELRVSILTQATLIGANLQNSNLNGADLSDADLSGADLSGADLSGADFRNTKGLSIEQVKQAKSLCGTKFPQRITESLQAFTKFNYSCRSRN